jgi:tetratricopeptide (TPR) repeat protein
VENRDAIAYAAQDLGIHLDRGFGEVAGGFDDVAAAMDALAVGLEGGLSAIAREAKYTNHLLSSIDSALTNPRRTSALERLTWAVQHLRNDRPLEARDEFEAALAEHPYESGAWFGLALARSALECDPASVAEAFSSCSRYDDADPGRRAQAALLAAAAYQDNGDSAKAAEVLTDATRRTPECVELGVAALRTGGNRAAFIAAAVYDPERALVLASAAGFNARELAGPIAEQLSQDAQELTDAINKTETAAKRAGWSISAFERPPRQPHRAVIAYAHLRSSAAKWAEHELAKLDRGPGPRGPDMPAPLAPASESPYSLGGAGCLSFPISIVASMFFVAYGQPFGINTGHDFGRSWIIWITLSIVGGLLLMFPIAAIKGNPAASRRSRAEAQHAAQMKEWTTQDAAWRVAVAARLEEDTRLDPVRGCLRVVATTAQKPWRADPIAPRATMDPKPPRAR